MVYLPEVDARQALAIVQLFRHLQTFLIQGCNKPYRNPHLLLEFLEEAMVEIDRIRRTLDKVKVLS